MFGHLVDFFWYARSLWISSVIFLFFIIFTMQTSRVSCGGCLKITRMKLILFDFYSLFSSFIIFHSLVCLINNQITFIFILRSLSVYCEWTTSRSYVYKLFMLIAYCSSGFWKAYSLFSTQVINDPNVLIKKKKINPKREYRKW